MMTVAPSGAFTMVSDSRTGSSSFPQGPALDARATAPDTHPSFLSTRAQSDPSRRATHPQRESSGICRQYRLHVTGAKARGGAHGRTVPGSARDNSERMACPAQRPVRLCATSGPEVRTTPRTLRPGLYPNEKVLYTGDLFEKDEEGYLYFLSRKDDIIKTAGHMVSPKEVENVLCEKEDVVEAAVIGVEDEILGKAIQAFVHLTNDSETTEEDILRFCSERLENFAVPRKVILCGACTWKGL